MECERKQDCLSNGHIFFPNEQNHSMTLFQLTQAELKKHMAPCCHIP